MKNLKKYLAILAISLKSYNIFLWDIIWKNIIYIIRILVILTMYKAIYKFLDAKNTTYTLQQVSWWLIFVQSLVTSRPPIITDISQEIKSWNIVNYLLNPISYNWYKFITYFTQYFYNLIINLSIWFLIWYLYLGWIETSFNWILWWLVLLFWSMLLQYFAHFIIWLFSFYLEDVEWIRMIYNFSDRLFGWNILPIPFFPMFIQNIVYLSPFAYAWYTAWLIFSRFEIDKFYFYITVQFFWIMVYMFISNILYMNAKKNLTINWW